ncbi:hypothetical protein GCM10027589_01550 [Actinocorallia lasiicapitis]
MERRSWNDAPSGPLRGAARFVPECTGYGLNAGACRGSTKLSAISAGNVGRVGMERRPGGLLLPAFPLGAGRSLLATAGALLCCSVLGNLILWTEGSPPLLYLVNLLINVVPALAAASVVARSAAGTAALTALLWLTASWTTLRVLDQFDWSAAVDPLTSAASLPLHELAGASGLPTFGATALALCCALLKGLGTAIALLATVALLIRVWVRPVGTMKFLVPERSAGWTEIRLPAGRRVAGPIQVRAPPAL